VTLPHWPVLARRQLAGFQVATEGIVAKAIVALLKALAPLIAPR
jgi:hypothetical protein